MAIGWFLVVIPLGIDIFAAGMVFGLSGMARERWQPTALVFAAIGGALFGLGAAFGQALSGVVGVAAAYAAGAMLLALGLKAVVHGLKGGDGAEKPAT